MSLTDQAENDLLELIFNNTDWALIGDAGGLQNSATAGSLYVSLTTADPTDTATSQATSESAYTSYARVAVARSAGGWTVSTNNASNTAATTFPACTGTGSTVTNFGIGTASSGAGYLILKGALDSSLAISNGITPSFAATLLDVNVD